MKQHSSVYFGFDTTCYRFCFLWLIFISYWIL